MLTPPIDTGLSPMNNPKHIAIMNRIHMMHSGSSGKVAGDGFQPGVRSFLSKVFFVDEDDESDDISRMILEDRRQTNFFPGKNNSTQVTDSRK